jgi:hypothetical protein
LTVRRAGCNKGNSPVVTNSLLRKKTSRGNLTSAFLLWECFASMNRRSGLLQQMRQVCCGFRQVLPCGGISGFRACSAGVI